MRYGMKLLVSLLQKSLHQVVNLTIFATSPINQGIVDAPPINLGIVGAPPR